MSKLTIGYSPLTERTYVGRINPKARQFKIYCIANNESGSWYPQTGARQTFFTSETEAMREMLRLKLGEGFAVKEVTLS